MIKAILSFSLFSGKPELLLLTAGAADYFPQRSNVLLQLLSCFVGKISNITIFHLSIAAASQNNIGYIIVKMLSIKIGIVINREIIFDYSTIRATNQFTNSQINFILRHCLAQNRYISVRLHPIANFKLAIYNPKHRNSPFTKESTVKNYSGKAHYFTLKKFPHNFLYS